MEKIRKYVKRFFKTNSGNERYQIYTKDIRAIKEEMDIDPFDALTTLFDYGYAKGYRAALSEMKKKGGVYYGGETERLQRQDFERWGKSDERWTLPLSVYGRQRKAVCGV